MARGTIAWRCWICKKTTTKETCHHRGAKYYIAYFLGKQQRWEPVGRNKKEAERRLTGIMDELQQGTFRLPKPILFGEFAEQWLKDYARARVRISTFRLYSSLIRGHLKPAFGDLLLTEIFPQQVQRFLTQCLREKGLSPRTTNYSLFLLKVLFKYARQWGYLKESAVESVKPIRQERKEMAFLHPEGIQIFLKSADEPYRTLFLTAILTGMRRGELLGLQWGDIDWNGGLIHVRRTLSCLL